ncbi:hypothetical protein [Streptomyces xantholiticus]|uniref:hypothetical protein n=1 Tax=Streptomyces xantholiticus TaxID=68285 RepID=UPI001676D62D|nr:hypothetical protein [Streptomyces xantholiticus]GGW60103.1 hypothetical protein GCM10010381_51620 [Streptomyces xantholiticus]
MATHAAMPHRRRRTHEPRHHSPLAWALPVTLGLTFGIWAAVIKRVEEGGVATGGQWVLGVITALVLAGLAFGLGRIQHRLPRELRALAYGALTAATIGFLTSLAGGSVLRAAGIGVAVGVGVGMAVFYFYYTRE